MLNLLPKLFNYEANLTLPLCTLDSPSIKLRFPNIVIWVINFPNGYKKNALACNKLVRNKWIHNHITSTHSEQLKKDLRNNYFWRDHHFQDINAAKKNIQM